MWDLLRIPIDRWFRARDRRPRLGVRQVVGYGSSERGRTINVGLVNDGGAIARGVVVRITVDGEPAGESDPVDVKQNEPEKVVRVLVDKRFCNPGLAAVGLLPRGQVTVEAWHRGTRVAWCPGRQNP